MVYKIILGRNELDRKKYGDKGALVIGKQYITMGKTISLANLVMLDVAKPHVLLISGKRGGGKCLHEDTLITLSDGRVKKIKDLESDNCNIIGLNKDLKVTNLVKDEFFKRKVSKLLHIKLRSGKELKLTPEHPLLTINGWVDAKGLSVNNRIATPRKLNFFGNQELEESKIKLLAYLLAEGHLSNGFVLFSNFDQELIDDFSKSVKDFNPDLQIKQHSKPGCYRVSQKTGRYDFDNKRAVRNNKGQFIKSGIKREKNSLTKWLIEQGVYDKLSLEKIIPEVIFQLPKYQLALFLNRLFSCDGSLYKSSVWRASYSSSSKELIRQVQHLLLRFEVLSRLRKKKVYCNSKEFITYELVINRVNLIKFIEEIGFFGVKNRLQELAISEARIVSNNPNVDTIPKGIWDSYRPDNWASVGRDFGYKNPKALRSSINYGPSRQKLAQIAFVDGNESMYQLATSDIFWDEIMEVNELLGEFSVYDISVPEYHNFVANDVIVHNSYTMGVITEAMADMPPEVANNLASIIFDTMGIFWTMKFPNYRDEELMASWPGIEPKSFEDSVIIYVPEGLFDDYRAKGIPADKPFSISCSEISVFDWAGLFEVSINDKFGILITRVINGFIGKGVKYGVEDIIAAARKDKKSDELTKEAVANMFENVRGWGLFSKEGSTSKDLIHRGKTSIIDLSGYAHQQGGFSIRALVIGLVSKRILEERIISRKIEELLLIKKGARAFEERAADVDVIPQVWIFIDEAHEFLPREGLTLASNALIQVIREGRQPGVSLVLATQQPGKIHTDVITQADLVLSHRLTARIDITALNQVMQTYLGSDIQKYLDMLPARRGTAIVLDDKLERMYPIQIRPRMTWHGGAEPEVIPPEKKNEKEAKSS